LSSSSLHPPHIFFETLINGHCQIPTIYQGKAFFTSMAETTKHTFVNYDQSNPRPTQTQRQTVSAFIEDIIETVQPPHNEHNRPLTTMTEGRFLLYSGHRQG
jgi:hypothetical protein